MSSPSFFAHALLCTTRHDTASEAMPIHSARSRLSAAETPSALVKLSAAPRPHSRAAVSRREGEGGVPLALRNRVPLALRNRVPSAQPKPNSLSLAQSRPSSHSLAQPKPSSHNSAQGALAKQRTPEALVKLPRAPASVSHPETWALATKTPRASLPSSSKRRSSTILARMTTLETWKCNKRRA